MARKKVGISPVREGGKSLIQRVNDALRSPFGRVASATTGLFAAGVISPLLYSAVAEYKGVKEPVPIVQEAKPSSIADFFQPSSSEAAVVRVGGNSNLQDIEQGLALAGPGDEIQVD